MSTFNLSEEFFEKGAFLLDPETDEVLLAYGGEVTRTDNFDTSKTAFYLKDFYQDHFLAYHPEHSLRLSRHQLLALLEKVDDSIEVCETRNSDELYEQDFQTLKKAWNENLRKVVLTSREEYKVSSAEKLSKALLKKALTFGAGMPYGFWYENHGVIGATPETLFAVKGQELTTMALAGTIKKGQEQELLNSPKDRKEHELVVQDIREKLTPFCQQINIAETGLSGFKDMVHLHTGITAQLQEGANLAALTCALSPTAALGGYPTQNALEFLKQTQFAQRWPERYFGSAFGVSSPEYSHFIVSIRNVQWQEELLIIESGGGVLPESVLEKELAEIGLKRQTIRKHYL